MNRANAGGFSLIEMLIVIVVIGVLLAIGADRMVSLRARLRLDRAAQLVAQELQACRSLSLAKSRVCRVVFSPPNQFEVSLSSTVYSDPSELGGFCSDTRFSSLRKRQLPSGVRLDNVQSGDCIAFDTRGFAQYGPNTPGQIVLSDGTRQERVIPSIVGSVKVVR